MTYRWSMGAITLALAGCFSEPPGSGSSGSSTTENGSSSSGTPVDDTSGGVAESTSESGGTTDPDTETGPTSTTTTTPPDEVICDLDRPIDTGRVPADVLVIVGAESSVPNGFLESFDDVTHVAVIAPEGVASALEPDVLEACWDGCGDACNAPDRLLIPYAAGALGEEFGTFLGPAFECIFRLPPIDQPVSAPSRQVWLFTQSPSLAVPDEVEIRMLTLGLRLHVACPGCDEPPKGWADTDLGRLVEQTQGSIGDSDGMLSVQAGPVTAPRTSCVWDEELPRGLLIANGFSPPDEPFFVSDRAEAGFQNCEEVFPTEEGEDEIFPMFFENEDGYIELCPVACRLAQLPHANGTDIYRCD